MKKLTFTLLLLSVFGVALMAQKPTGVVKKTTTAPTIDGTVDEVWATANTYSIDKIYREETPSVGGSGETTWKALYDDDGIYVLVTVMDDIWSPVFTGAVPGSAWLYDKPEVYFDVNEELEDSKGPQTDGLGLGNGHYQFAPSPIDGEIDGTTSGSGTDNHDQLYGWKVNDPDYTVEYFVSFDLLLDGAGSAIDKTRKIGFDVTVIDNDDNAAASPTRSRAVWANIGSFDESWTNMDECGTITLEGLYVSGVVATSVSISSTGGATTIETDEGTLQMLATVLPAEADMKEVKWTVTNGTGTAFIGADGVLHALTNGTVTVKGTTKDGSNKSATMEITLSHQSLNMADLSLVKNGDFLADGPTTSPWIGSATVTDGVAVCVIPSVGADSWSWVLSQQLKAENDIPYIFTFNAYADAERTFNVDFEDANNDYNRYGVSDDPESTGESEWTFMVGWEPKTYVFHVTFTEIVANTIQSMQFRLGNAAETVYLDSIYLVAEDDLDKITPLKVSEKSINAVSIYPNPIVNELNVVLSSSNAKLDIYNSIGRKMDEVQVNGNIARIDVSSYAKGLYFMKVNNTIVKKFIK